MTSEFARAGAAVLLGLVTGLLSGTFGVGGGIIATPLMRIILGVQPHTAIGTTLALIVPTSIAGAYNYLRAGNVDVKTAVKLGVPATAGIVFGAFLAHHCHGQALMFAFVLLMCLSGLDLIFGLGRRFSASPQGAERKKDAATASSIKERTGWLALGTLIGIVAGFFGVGGGFILIPCLIYFYKMEVKKAFGTSLLFIAIIALPGTLTHAWHGQVDLPLALWMTLGSLPGSFAGSWLALRLRDTWLRSAFGFVLIVMAAILAMKEDVLDLIL